MEKRNKKKREIWSKEYREKNKEKIRKVANKWKKDNPEKVKDYYNNIYKHVLKEEKHKKRTKNSYLKRVYNITLEEYNLMLYKQNNKCLICKVDASTLDKSLAVDHCHNTGKVRALLCTRCNTAIGLFKEDINLLQESINYINTFQDDNPS